MIGSGAHGSHVSPTTHLVAVCQASGPVPSRYCCWLKGLRFYSVKCSLAMIDRCLHKSIEREIWRKERNHCLLTLVSAKLAKSESKLAGSWICLSQHSSFGSVLGYGFLPHHLLFMGGSRHFPPLFLQQFLLTQQPFANIFLCWHSYMMWTALCWTSDIFRSNPKFSLAARTNKQHLEELLAML